MMIYLLKSAGLLAAVLTDRTAVRGTGLTEPRADKPYSGGKSFTLYYDVYMFVYFKLCV